MFENEIKTGLDQQVFRFKQFEICQDQCSMKVGTDGVLLGAWANVQGARRMLDIGCGSGLIALMLAQRNSKAAIDAVEIEEQAWQQALHNVRKSPWAERLQIFYLAIQEFAGQQEAVYDSIVSNPPFFSGGTFSSNQSRNEVRHTVKLPHGDLLAAARRLMNKDGKFSVILPFIEGLRFMELAEQYGLYCTRSTEVTPRTGKSPHRLLLQFERNQKEIIKDRLVIQKGTGRHEYTSKYKTLTQSFYLNM